QFLSDARRESEQALRPRTRRQHARRALLVHGSLPAARLPQDVHVPRARPQPGSRVLMAYLLDADVFIRAKNLHYGFDFCPAFWEWLVEQNAAGKVFSVEKVGNEVLAVADELSDWARTRGPGFFLRPDASVQKSLAAVSAWASAQ